MWSHLQVMFVITLKIFFFAIHCSSSIIRIKKILSWIKIPLKYKNLTKVICDSAYKNIWKYFISTPTDYILRVSQDTSAVSIRTAYGNSVY